MMRSRIAVGLAAAALATPGFAALASAADEASLSVLHGIPDTPVDVYVNGALTIDDFQPGDLAGPLALAAGDYEVALTATDAADASAPVLGPRGWCGCRRRADEPERGDPQPPGGNRLGCRCAGGHDRPGPRPDRCECRRRHPHDRVRVGERRGQQPRPRRSDDRRIALRPQRREHGLCRSRRGEPWGGVAALPSAISARKTSAP